MPGGYWGLTFAVLVPAVAYASWIDYAQRRVPNWLNAAIAMAGFVAQGFFFGWSGIAAGALGLLVGFGVLIIPWAMHGMGGPGYKVKAEFNSKPHKRGVVSMARANDPDSAGSQFFICVADSNFLDWQYTVFAEVASGMEVADKIVSAKRDGRDNPVERIEMTVMVSEG